jgi:hypothetical protein
METLSHELGELRMKKTLLLVIATIGFMVFGIFLPAKCDGNGEEGRDSKLDPQENNPN